MTAITIHTRSFHPDKNFGLEGLGFKGDDRGFSIATEGTPSRIYDNFVVNLRIGAVSPPICRSYPSENILGSYNNYSDPRKQPRKEMPVQRVTPYRPDGDQTVNLKFWYAGQNFGFNFADTDWGHAFYSTVVPDLDVTHDFSLRINRAEGKAILSSSIGGDGFPNCESFMIDAPGKTCVIGTHVRIGTAATQLPGGRVLPMTQTIATLDWTAADAFGANIDVSLAFDYTGNGGPQTVVHSGSMAITAWNDLHTGRDASGDWVRQLEDNVPLGRQIPAEIGRGAERVWDGATRELMPYLDPGRRFR